jgi:hypothetical protein
VSPSVVFQGVLVSVLVALILGLGKLFREFVELKTSVKPLLTWYEKTSLDALKIATNPTDKRLAELADRYVASISGQGRITAQEKQELIEGLQRVLDGHHDPYKRQSASLSLRFIEAREGVKLQ